MKIYSALAAHLVFTFCLLATLETRAGFSRQFTLTFCCAPTNDLFTALSRAKYRRFDTPLAAIENAKANTAVLILADEYPEYFTRLSAKELSLAQEKNLRLFIEFPNSLPGLEIGSVRTTQWERGVVSSDAFGTGLPKLRILAIHDCHFVSIPAKDPWLVIARVAGYDTAVYGLPKDAQPILFGIPGKNIIAATTKLSGFVTARFAPAKDWESIWQIILAKLDPSNAPHRMEWRPSVQTAFSAAGKLPRNFERRVFGSSANWIVNSRLLVAPSRKNIVEKTLAAGGENIETPGAHEPTGDGSLGIQEGYSSGILHDGNQIQRLPLRADCNAESAMVLALDALLNKSKRSAEISKNLLDYVYFNSGMCGGVRADPKNAAYGLIGWGAIAPAWLVANYGDDNARTILGTIVASACLKEPRWDDAVTKAVLANFRTTGKLGFRTDRLDVPALQQNGWKAYYDGSPIDYSPHFESYLWACNLWAFRQTGFRPFLDKTTNAIAMTMRVYPDGWRWCDNIERARMLLCLSWLIRVEDTQQHREWLNRVAHDLLAAQSSSGAIHEKLGGTGGGHYQIPQSNEAYGTGETPLIQTNGDPASDQLYTTGFALLGLHEAVGATGDKKLRAAENKLADFLCRIQIRSEKVPYLNGWWFRAFDDRRWEFWASSADIGWGAWSVEAGWGQAWTAAVLGLREKKTTVWDLTAKSRIAENFEKLRAEMEK